MLEFFIRNLWLWKCGLPEEEKINLPGPEVLRETQMSKRFIELMENRMILGTFRYGYWQNSNGSNYDRIGSAKSRIDKFTNTGNLEYLVDAANMLMIEFEISKHPNKHFKSIDDGEHAARK